MVQTILPPDQEPWLGIDIGTNYTRAFIWNPQSKKVEPVVTELGEKKVASVVAYDEDERVICGSKAKIHRSGIQDARKILGRSYEDEDI